MKGLRSDSGECYTAFIQLIYRQLIAIKNDVFVRWLQNFSCRQGAGLGFQTVNALKKEKGLWYNEQMNATNTDLYRFFPMIYHRRPPEERETLIKVVDAHARGMEVELANACSIRTSIELCHIYGGMYVISRSTNDSHT